MNLNKKEYLARHEAARFSGYSITTLYKWVKLGYIKKYWLNGRYFKREEIEQFLNKRN